MASDPIPLFQAANVEALHGNLIREAALEQIEHAVDRLWLAYFLVGLDPRGGRSVNALADAVVRAAHRGVDVRLLVSPFESGPERLRANAPALAWFKQRNVPVREFTPRRYDDNRLSQRRSMHSKFLIRDDGYVVVGSGNLTPGGTDSNHELALLVASDDMAATMTIQFEAMWRRAAVVA